MFGAPDSSYVYSAHVNAALKKTAMIWKAEVAAKTGDQRFARFMIVIRDGRFR